MALSLPVLGFVLLLVLCLGVGLFLARRSSRGRTLVERTAAHHLARGRWAALAVALIAFALVAVGVPLGRGFVLAPAVAGALAAGVLVLTERSVPTEAASLRSVTLEPRSAMRWIRRSTWVTGAVDIALLAAVIILGWATATADDQGRTGRGVEWAITGGSQGGGPWLGPYYSVPVLVALAVATLAVVAGCRIVAARPQVNADALAGLSDDDMRRHSARLLQAVYLVVLGLTLGALSLMALGATSFVEPGAPSWVRLAHWLGVVGALAGAGSVIVGAVTGVKR